ncbi:MAG: right-handed parallel beta-helix repeat-containing protein, partial [Verrucomicrobia bacterium]|nr:right-handed parallel beta-helix repeat-containing protein [Verrucomicrobiota bacterium]
TGGLDGVNVSNGSIQFTLKNSILYDNASSGLAIIDYGSSNALVQDNVFYGTVGDANHDQNTGAYLRGQDPTVLRNLAYHNNGWSDNGIYVQDAGVNVVVKDNQAWNNSGTAIYVRSASYEVSGNVVRDSSRGFWLEDNGAGVEGQAHDNVAYGISNDGFEVYGSSQVHDNEAYECGTGFALLSASGVVRDNVSWRNGNGFWSNNGTIANNRSYGNTTGIYMNNQGVTVSGNRVYDNQTGIYSDSYVGTNTIINNLVYDNSGRGVLLNSVQTSGGSMTLVNNTVMEKASDALEILGNSQNVSLKNNILWSGGAGHYAISVADGAQRGFASDYNEFYFTDGAKLGLWQNPFGSLADWRYELGFDTHSLFGDPQFVAPEGSDGIRGYQDSEGLKFEYWTNRTFSGAPTTVQYDREVSSGLAFGGFRGLPGGSNQSFRWSGDVYLAQAGSYTFSIYSLNAQRLTINGQVVVDDFTNPSRQERTGTYTATQAGWVSLKFEVSDTSGQTQLYLTWSTPDNRAARLLRAHEAPTVGAGVLAAQRSVLRYSNAPASNGVDDDFHLSSTAGSFHGGLWQSDAVDSPLIDAGDLTSPYAVEPGPNGKRINLGFEGNTSEASKSHDRVVQLLTFIGGEKVRQGQGSLILWRTVGLAPNEPLSVEFSSDGGSTFVTLATARVNDGGFAWNPATPTQKGLIRLRSESFPGATDVSRGTFVVGTASRSFYVNDGSRSGDQYTSAVGSNANSGTTPADPMASLNALLAAYKLGAGDVVYVDTGYYNLPTNLKITADDSGVTITGPVGAPTQAADYITQVLADNPMAYYRLNNATGALVATDSSGNGLDAGYVGSYTGGVVGALNGLPDTAATLDGQTGYLKAPTSAVDVTHGITLELWVNPTAVTPWQRFFDLGNGAANNNIIFLRNNATNDLYVQSLNGSSAGPTVTASGAIELNKWQYFAVTVTADGNAVIYKNGRAVASGKINPLTQIARTSNLIGASNWPNEKPFAGSMDEVAIYSSVLSADRIAAHFGTTSSGAVLDRGNVGAARYTVELNSAADVTLRNLGFTGGEQGLVAFNADRLTLVNNVAYENSLRGFYVDTDVDGAVIRNNVAYGTTGNASIDQDGGFYLRGSRMTVDGNIAYKVGSQFGDGIYVDSASALTYVNNLAYNNTNGLTVILSQGVVHDNEARNNGRGLLVNDTDGSLRTPVYQNNVHDNDVGLVAQGSTETYNTRVTLNRVGILLSSAGDNTWVRDNYVVKNSYGIEANAGRVFRNRVVGNLVDGLLLDANPVYSDSNIIYGNAVGIEIVGSSAGGSQVVNSFIYQNTNQEIYIHNVLYNGAIRVVNNTLYHDTGSAIRVENSNQPPNLYNNIIVINSGLGVEVIGNAAGFDSNYNDIFTTRPGANVGRFQGQPISATLDAWRTASGKDANSMNTDPLFTDLNGSDNLLGWTQPDPQSQFADFGRDDNVHLRGKSPAVDAANSDLGTSLDLEANARVDDLGTPNTGAGVYRFFDLGAFEFTGSSSDIVPPTLVSISPIGVSGTDPINQKFTQLVLSFSEPLQPLSAQSLAFYLLSEAGVDRALGTGDDVPVGWQSVGYTPGTKEVTLTLPNQLAQGLYRLTLVSGAQGAIVDRSGNALDGDRNGSAGGNFIRDFQLDLSAPVVGSITPSGFATVGPSQFTVVFQENLQMNASTVTDRANYSLTSTTGEVFGAAGDVDETSRINTIVYDPATKTATVKLTGALPARRYLLTVKPGIVDQAGNPLGNGSAASGILAVNVPALAPIGDQSIYDGNLLTLPLSGSAPAGSSLRWSLGAGSPGGASVSNSGVFTWNPTEAQAGATYAVRVIIADANAPSLTDSKTFNVTVLANPAPTVVAATVNGGEAQRSRVSRLSFQFNVDVAASLGIDDFVLLNLTTGTTTPAAQLGLTLIPGAQQAVLSFPGLPGQILPEGNYQLVLKATGVSGSHGKFMKADFKLSFHVLTGDANGDRVTNDRDLYQVWQNLLKPAASRNLNEDLNGDGAVTLADVAVVKSRYLATLPAAPPPPTAPLGAGAQAFARVALADVASATIAPEQSSAAATAPSVPVALSAGAGEESASQPKMSATDPSRSTPAAPPQSRQASAGAVAPYVDRAMAGPTYHRVTPFETPGAWAESDRIDATSWIEAQRSKPRLSLEDAWDSGAALLVRAFPSTCSLALSELPNTPPAVATFLSPLAPVAAPDSGMAPAGSFEFRALTFELWSDISSNAILLTDLGLTRGASVAERKEVEL